MSLKRHVAHDQGRGKEEKVLDRLSIMVIALTADAGGNG
jgi:hypothetical protein